MANNGVITCCKNCTERYLACNDYCDKYLDERNSNLEKQKQFRKAKQAEEVINDYVIINREIQKRRHR